MKKSTIWKNIILIASVWIVIIVATLAWFNFHTTGYANDLGVKVGEAFFVQISGDGGNNWSDDLDIEIGVNKYLKEMSGDGKQLFTPVYGDVQKPDGGFTKQIVEYQEVTDDTYYYEQIFDFRTDGEYELYLDPASCIRPVLGEEVAPITGAVRVAFYELDDDGNETLKYIWAPNSKIEFSRENGSFTTDGNAEPRYYYQKTTTAVDMSVLESGVYNPNVVKIPANATTGSNACAGCGYNAEHKFMWSCGSELPDNAPPLLMFEPGEDGMSQKRLKVKVWLEGYDRECVRQISGQRFTMQFQFKADKENTDE